MLKSKSQQERPVVPDPPAASVEEATDPVDVLVAAERTALEPVVQHAKAEAARWSALADDVAAELATVTDPTHHGALLRHGLRVRHAEMLLHAESCSAQVLELGGS